MKKRMLCLALALVLSLALPLTARADVIYEPVDDFYDAHWSECSYANRSYTANGPGGELTWYQSPENSLIEHTIPNGEAVYISVIYTAPDGTEWGCAEDWDENKTGWVPMAYTVKIYNHEDFAAEFSERIRSESGDLSECLGQDIWCWSYPGDDSGYTITLNPEYSAPAYSRVFTDDAGQRWCCVDYHYGNKNFWVCLSNPTADYETLYADHAPQQVTKPEITEPSEDIVPGGIPPAVVLAAAAAVAAVSAGVLIGLKKKK